MIVSHDDADHLGGIAFGGPHGVSLLLEFNNVPGDYGDDDGNGIADWIRDEPYFEPDPDELGLDDDVMVANFVDYGDDLMRKGIIAIQKYQSFADGMGNRITVNDQATVDQFEIELGQGAKLICLAANGFVRDRQTRVANVNTPNERSLSFLLKYKGFEFLISGDLTGRKSGGENAKVEEAVGEYIAAKGYKVDVLHVNHHRANNASSKKFLKLISPKIAIISAGNGNSHAHPDKEVLERLVEAKVDRIIQTSWGTTEEIIPAHIREHQAIWQQDVIVRSDGKYFWLETSRRWTSK